MSGGSMNYLYQKVRCDATFEENTPYRAAFRKHLEKVAEALRMIEWVDSDDCRPGDDEEAIKACLGKGAVLEAALARAREAKEDLEKVIAECSKGGPERKVSGKNSNLVRVTSV